MDNGGKCTVSLPICLKFLANTQVIFFYNTLVVYYFCRCWDVFLKYHLCFGYGFWAFCMVIHQSPWYHYLATTIAFILEEIILFSSAWLVWITDAPYKAGETIISEYLLIIAIRWLTVLIFEFSLLTYVIRAIFAVFELVIYGI